MNRWLDRYPAMDAAAKALRQPIHEILAKVSPRPARIGVAVSGGPDSAMLAVQLALLAPDLGIQPHVFHVHHGLQGVADKWRDHVHDLAHGLGAACHSRRVVVAANAGKGIEAAARDARYHAFRDMAGQAGVSHILLAHHRDDQAETVLLRLLRGSGPAGLSAMAPQTERDGLTFLRPWLGIERAAIMQQMQLFFMASGWAPVYDPTNHHDAYTRSAVRERLAPALNQRWPGWQSILARHARLAAQTKEILDEVAASDFASLEPGDDDHSFSLACWRLLSPSRQAHVMRYWLQRLGRRAPSEARLNDIMRQLRGLHALGHDRDMRVKHAGDWICCRRGRVLLRPYLPDENG